jgi:uncharacterized protein YukE
MEAMRQSWTDDRLDDLSRRMDERFDHVEGEMNQGFERVEGEMNQRFEPVEGEITDLRAEIKAQGKELRGEMAGMEARLRAQASEHYVRTGEELAKMRGESHSDKQQLLAEMQALQRTLVQIGWTGAIALIAALAGVLISHL